MGWMAGWLWIEEKEEEKLVNLDEMLLVGWLFVCLFVGFFFTSTGVYVLLKEKEKEKEKTKKERMKRRERKEANYERKLKDKY